MGHADPGLVDRIGDLIAATSGDRPALIAVVGAQGSGKTTLARAAADRFGGVQISIDDVYLTRAEREAMAREVHPLLRTRGPPGTHDLALLWRVIDDLSAAGPDQETLIPVFDKRGDDRRPVVDWARFVGRPSAILIDAWCLGATAEDPAALRTPVNALERDRDADGRWRGWVNAQVAGPYADLVAGFDAVVFLQAPDFAVVHDWRCQQEAEVLGVPERDLTPADRARIADFIRYFERLTRRMIAGGVIADLTVKLDRNRLVSFLTE